MSNFCLLRSARHLQQWNPFGRIKVALACNKQEMVYFVDSKICMVYLNLLHCSKSRQLSFNDQ
jgi:hypothetical protein